MSCQRCYKLTEADLTTYGGHRWRPLRWARATGPADGLLCSDSWLHGYDDLYVAAMMHPLHVDFARPVAWEAQTRGPCLRSHDGMVGWREMRLIRRVELPTLTTTVRVRVGISAAQAAGRTPAWSKWASGWLSGVCQTRQPSAWGAPSAAEAVGAAAWAAAWAAKEQDPPIDIGALVRQTLQEEKGVSCDTHHQGGGVTWRS